MRRHTPDWNVRYPPDLAEFEAIAREAYDDMPEGFRSLCGNVVLHVAEQAEPEILRKMGIANPLHLSGLFEGVGLPDIGVSHPYPYPNHVHLYRRSIIAEWRARRGAVTLKQLIAHVLVHEIGHHFGFSDDEMHDVEDEAE